MYNSGNSYRAFRLFWKIMTNTTNLDLNSEDSEDVLDLGRLCGEIENGLQKLLSQLFSESWVDILVKLTEDRGYYKINLLFDINVLLSKTAAYRYPRIITGYWNNRRRLDTEARQERFINHMVDRLARVVFKREFGTEKYKDILKVINYIYTVQKDPVLSLENNLQIDGKLRFYNLKLNCNDPSEPYVKGLISSNKSPVYENPKMLPEGVVLKSFRCTTNDLNLIVEDVSPDSCKYTFYWNLASNIRLRRFCKFNSNRKELMAWKRRNHFYL